jgi:hypothetical protein
VLRRLLALTLSTAALAGCGTTLTLGDGPERAAGAEPERAAEPRRKPGAEPGHKTGAGIERVRPAMDSWHVGAEPLPLRPDGFGRVLPTPPELRVRRMPTVDVLSPPTTAAFHADVSPVSTEVRTRMGRSWTPRCPVQLDDLRYLTLTFWGFDRRPHTGELVVNERAARDVVSVFRRLFRARYPIEQMRLVSSADLDAPPAGDGNNTAALVCRPVRGQTEWSAHAYGLAVDVNPFLNPYRTDDLVLPELAGAYLDRGWRRPGMIRPGGVVVDAFTSVGWTWGGTFDSVTDYMHFSATGG